MPDIRIHGLSKQFGATHVLEGLDLTVRDGEFLTLLGPSGCGKSTLLRLIAGLDQPDAGTIHLGERDLLPLSPGERDCAMVFQSYALYPHMTVGENICTPLLMRGLNFWQRLPGMRWLSPAVRRQHALASATARKVAQSLGIDALWARKPAQLSGGQRQRVALARALAAQPRALLLDEPLTALDAKLRDVLRLEIDGLLRRLGITAIYVTHDQAEAMALGDRILVMDHGKVAQIGSPREIYQRPASRYVAEFIGTMNRLSGQPESGGFRTAGGLLPWGDAPSSAREAWFRPEDTTLADTTGAQLAGRVDAAFFLGDRTRLFIAIGDNKPLVVETAERRDFRIGDMVGLRVDASRILAL